MVEVCSSREKEDTGTISHRVIDHSTHDTEYCYCLEQSLLYIG